MTFTARRLLRCVATSSVAMACALALAAVDVDALWNYADPAASEARFRAALATAQGDDALVLRTQIARTLGLRQRFVEALRELDAVEAELASAGAAPRVRAALERGRTLRSSGRAADSMAHFERAFAAAEAARLERLAGDALHMLALVAPTLEQRIEWNRRTIDYARRAADPKARGWVAPALNNIGNDLRQARRLDESLLTFREALAAFERHGSAGEIRIARWQVANVLRLQGKVDEALAMQLALERDAAAAGQPDAYVYDELALLHRAAGQPEAADKARARAAQLRAR
jgi:tetratricopeptide (TPR) repeat protein